MFNSLIVNALDERILTTSDNDSGEMKMFKKSLGALSRNFLIDVALSSEKSESLEIKAFVEKMKSVGAYGDATEDDIEELDLILES